MERPRDREDSEHPAGAEDAPAEATSQASEPAKAEGSESGSPGGDSAGVYYLSIEAFESRLPREQPARRDAPEKPEEVES